MATPDDECASRMIVDPDDSGGPCLVCGDWCGESLRCHGCDHYLHDGCYDDPEHPCMAPGAEWGRLKV